MKKLIAGLSLMLVSLLSAAGVSFAQSPPAGSPVARHGQLRVEGSRMLGQSGDPVQLRGVSFYWSNGRNARNFYNAGVVSWLRSDWQADVVRAAMGVQPVSGSTKENWTWGGDEQGFPNDPANRTRVEAVVDAAIASGLYVIIDWHSHSAEDRQAEAVSFFQDMARTYGSQPNILYEIYNEPIGPLNDPGTTWRNIKPYMQAVTNAIRAIDARNLIILGTPYYCQFPDVAAADPVEGDNLLYSVHFYAGTTGAAHRDNLRNRSYNTLVQGKAVFVSEFGTCNSDGAGTHNAAETDIWMEFLDQFKISWANWSINSSGEAASALRSGASASGNWNSGNLSASGAYIRDKLRSQPSSATSFYSLAINIVGEGSVTTSPSSQIMYKGKTVRLIPQPNRAGGWTFGGWSGDLSGNDEPAEFVINGDMAVTATFVQQSASALPPGALGAAARWSVRRSGAGIYLSGPPSDGSAEVALYDTRGKLAGRYRYRVDRPAVASNIKIPAGNYLLAVRSGPLGKEVFKARVSLVD